MIDRIRIGNRERCGGVPSLRLRVLLNDPIVAKRLFVWAKKSEWRRMSPVWASVSVPPAFPPWPNVAQSWQMQIKAHHNTSTSQCATF